MVTLHGWKAITFMGRDCKMGADCLGDQWPISRGPWPLISPRKYGRMMASKSPCMAEAHNQSLLVESVGGHPTLTRGDISAPPPAHSGESDLADGCAPGHLPRCSSPLPRLESCLLSCSSSSHKSFINSGGSTTNQEDLLHLTLNSCHLLLGSPSHSL